MWDILTLRVQKLLHNSSYVKCFSISDLFLMGSEPICSKRITQSMQPQRMAAVGNSGTIPFCRCLVELGVGNA
jgi:hypothetical protein